jgi:signal transduction histidine kinase
MPSGFQADVAAVAAIAAVPTILEVVCTATGMGFAAVARVTSDRWIACGVRDEIAFGLRPGGELDVATTICQEVRQSGEAVVIDNVAEDALYCSHPTPALYGFQSYISVPIRLPDGSFFGTLCAIDPRPARLRAKETIGMFKLFADLIGFHLGASARLASSEASLASSEASLASTEANLASERRTAELREQFIAVLGHDLRNPLAAISGSAELLQRMQLDTKAARMVTIIQRSVARIGGLIDDVMDFARGQLGGGLTLDRTSEAALAPVLHQVVAELRTSFPDRRIETEIAIDRTILCDRTRIAQLLSNLLGNALAYGAPATPVRVRAVTEGDYFELSVANSGDPIPQAARERLFQPFARGAVRPTQQGLGLGLFIASEVARAHGGTLDVASSEAETRFTFRMPLA